MNGVHMEYTAGYRGSQAGACGVHGVITLGLLDFARSVLELVVLDSHKTCHI